MGKTLFNSALGPYKGSIGADRTSDPKRPALVLSILPKRC